MFGHMGSSGLLATLETGTRGARWVQVDAQPPRLAGCDLRLRTDLQWLASG